MTASLFGGTVGASGTASSQPDSVIWIGKTTSLLEAELARLGYDSASPHGVRPWS
ncbi:hypothetical protein [Yinghuangia sp. YIM S09857]|uniref:hypothetical protein n=1 Tax=Yinghuangia sp. YIM S09857 TaxID=3436929 RepID=UPI003F534C2B